MSQKNTVNQVGCSPDPGPLAPSIVAPIECISGGNEIEDSPASESILVGSDKAKSPKPEYISTFVQEDTIDDEMSFLAALLSEDDAAPLQLSAGPWSHESCTWDLQSTQHSSLLC